MKAKLFFTTIAITAATVVIALLIAAYSPNPAVRDEITRGAAAILFIGFFVALIEIVVALVVEIFNAQEND